jgi:hypothetical protein
MSMNAPAPTPLLARIPAHIGRKLILLVLLPPLLNVCYFLPQWAPLRHVRYHLPLTPIDRAIPFDTRWIIPYLSMYLFLIIPPALSVTVEQIRRYLIGMAIMFAVAALCFFFCPVVYDRPPLPTGAHWLYRLIVNMDQPINCIPSLHAGMTVYAMLFAHRILTHDPPHVRRTLLTLGWIWTALILYGTLATRQHYVLDLPAGALLAWGSHHVAWRINRPPNPIAI